MHKSTYWKIYLAVLFFGLICSKSANAQDPTFSQFYANPIYLNPALAGSNGCPRICMNYRNQWPSLSGTFVTYSASYDQYFKRLSGGIGIIATNDQMGKNTINTTTLSFIYSYHLKVTRKFSLLFGAQATWNQKFLDWSKLTFGDQIDPRRGFIYQTGDQVRGGNKGFLDVSAGIVGFTKHFYFGFAAYHLNQPQESMIVGANDKEPMRFVAHAGAEIPLGAQSKYNNSASISPSIIFQYQNGFMELNVGTYFKYGIFQVGFWLRNRDAFISTIGINTGVFKIGYSYDVTVSKLTNQSGGSHEVSLGLYLNCKTKPATFRTISCPSF